MATKIKAVETIIEWDTELGRMAILNPGDTAEVGDALAAAKVDCGHAELDKPKGKGKAAKQAADPEPTPDPESAPAGDDPADEDGAPV